MRILLGSPKDLLSTRYDRCDFDCIRGWFSSTIDSLSNYSLFPISDGIKSAEFSITCERSSYSYPLNNFYILSVHGRSCRLSVPMISLNCEFGYVVASFCRMSAYRRFTMSLYMECARAIARRCERFVLASTTSSITMPGFCVMMRSWNEHTRGMTPSNRYSR